MNELILRGIHEKFEINFKFSIAPLNITIYLKPMLQFIHRYQIEIHLNKKFLNYNYRLKLLLSFVNL